MLLSMSSCPFCLGGNNTPCFATFDNGYHCFTCGKKKSTDRLEFAYRPILQSTKKDLALPEHTQNVNKFSPNVLKWLYSFYVYDDLIRKYGIAYSEYAEFGQFKGESLILPVIVDGDLKSYQRRFFPHKQFLTKGDKTSPFIIKCVGSNQMVLVEDYISAIRVGQFCNVVCLQGVHIQWNALKLIENSNMDIIIWLDPDEAGQTAAKDLEQRLVNRLQLGSRYKAFSFREPRAISILQTGKQPKDYCDIELQKIIGEYKCLNQ